MSELTDIATGREPRLPQVDKFRDAFQPAGEIRKMAAGERDCGFIQQVVYDLSTVRQLSSRMLLGG